MMRCSCSELFDSHDPAGSYVHRGHVYATQRLAATRSNAIVALGTRGVGPGRPTAEGKAN
jgi:hypothetical protein